MAVLNTVASIVVYTPLVLIGLTVLYGIGYGVWHYKYNTATLGTLPPSYVKVIETLKFIILKILTPVKWIFQFLWWLIPITPGLRDMFNFVMLRGAPANELLLPMGAWAPQNITRTTPIVLLGVLLTIYALIYNYGAPATIAGYSDIINYILLGAGVLCILAMFISFNRRIMTADDWPAGGADLEERRRQWVTGTAGSYLYYSIGTGLALALLFTLFYFIANYTVASVTGSTMIMIAAGIAAIVLMYRMASQNRTVQSSLRGSAFLSNLFYLVFIIPCLFQDTVKFLFNQLRHTPRIAYMFLAGEFAFIGLYVLVPIIQKYLYTLMPPKDDKLSIIKARINGIKTNQIIINERIKRIKTFETVQKLNDKAWKRIISKGLNNVANEADLTKLLIEYGYMSKTMCQENKTMGEKKECEEKIQAAIKYIQSNTLELVGLQTKLKEAAYTLKDLEEEKNRVSDIEKSTVLLREPVYLNNLKNISDFDTVKKSTFDIEYNYNYALSAWFFIRAQAPSYGYQYNQYTSIMNYGGKPNILYNCRENRLKISMNNGKNQKPKTFIIDDFPLQKWTNIVVNYDGGILDVFMDSKLLASFNSIVPYMSQDQLTVGFADGVAGGVCNVVYFPQSISKERIDINYKILSNKNPPIV